MSYCRWSSDNYGCDVYVYASISRDWVTHVAGNRVVGDVPKLPKYSRDNDAWFEAHKKQTKFLSTAQRVPIGLPHDGRTFDDPSPGACADRLESLRALGYQVPQHAIDALREECAVHSKTAGSYTGVEFDDIE